MSNGKFPEKELDTDPAAPQAMTPPPEGPPRSDPVLLAHTRYGMKSLELMRLIVEAGFDADIELSRLQEVYRRRRDTAKLRIPVTDLPPKPDDE